MQTVTTSNANYPILLAPSKQTATTTITSYFDSGVTLNPSTKTIAANISGNAALATKATKDGNGIIIASTYLPLSGGTITDATTITRGAFTLKNYLHCSSIDFSSSYVTTDANYKETRTAQIRNEIKYEESAIKGIRIVFKVFYPQGTNTTLLNGYENYALPYTTAANTNMPTYNIITTKILAPNSLQLIVLMEIFSSYITLNRR